MALLLLSSLLLSTRSNGFVLVNARSRVATKRSIRATNDATNEQQESSSSFPSIPPPRDDGLPVLFTLLSPPPKCDVDRMSSTDLAYIGDVVYELLVRSKKVWPSKRTSDLQQQVVRLVRGMCLCMWSCCGRYIFLVGLHGIRSSILVRTRYFFVLVATAEFQSTLVTRLRQGNNESDTTPISFCLTDQEVRVMNRGRNAATKTNHRKANPVAYQDATALEALVGYLYISDPDRCTQLLEWIDAQLL